MTTSRGRTPEHQSNDDDYQPAKPKPPGSAGKLLPNERRADKVGDRALRLIEAVLTYVEANAIDYDGIWLDEGSEEDCEEFIHLYIDEKQDVDPPSFNAKHPHMRVSHFPSIVRNYLTRYANPMIPGAAISCVIILATSPNALTNENGQIINRNEPPPPPPPENSRSAKNKKVSIRKDEEDEVKPPKKDEKTLPEPVEVAESSSASFKFSQAKRIVAFLTPLETTILARLLVHIAALHHRACFNGLVWRHMGAAFSFLLRALSNDKATLATYTEKMLEFFVTNIDRLFDYNSLELLGEAAGNDSDYGTVKLSVLGRETSTRAKFRLFPGSPAATTMAKARIKQAHKRKNGNANTHSAVSWSSELAEN